MTPSFCRHSHNLYASLVGIYWLSWFHGILPPSFILNCKVVLGGQLVINFNLIDNLLPLRGTRLVINLTRQSMTWSTMLMLPEGGSPWYSHHGHILYFCSSLYPVGTFPIHFTCGFGIESPHSQPESSLYQWAAGTCSVHGWAGGHINSPVLAEACASPR